MCAARTGAVYPALISGFIWRPLVEQSSSPEPAVHRGAFDKWSPLGLAAQNKAPSDRSVLISFSQGLGDLLLNIHTLFNVGRVSTFTPHLANFGRRTDRESEREGRKKIERGRALAFTFPGSSARGAWGFKTVLQRLTTTELMVIIYGVNMAERAEIISCVFWWIFISRTYERLASLPKHVLNV